MMKTVSFFRYLYGTVALALVLTLTALFTAIYYLEEQNSWQDFARDIQQVLLISQMKCQTEDLTNHCVQQIFAIEDFDISLEAPPTQPETLGHWPYFDNRILVMPFQMGYQAQLDNQPDIWIRDALEHLQESADDDPFADIISTAAAMALVLLLAIAVFLYWPVKRLINWLKQLETAADALAQEDYSVNLPVLNISPFDQLSHRFNRMVLLIRSNLEEKRLLANAMAHEMRTPLSRARLALGLLQRQPGDELQTELLGDLDRYLDELEKVTDNSLQLVRLQNSETNMTSLSLDQWLQEKLHSRQGRGQSITWQADIDACTLVTDERFLTLIIDNLLSNAERYTHDQIHVSLKQRYGHVSLIITDNGPGIPASEIEKALQPFSRLDESRDRRSGGIGLGLALVSTACQRLDIQLSLNDAKPGLQVVLNFPDNR